MIEALLVVAVLVSIAIPVIIIREGNRRTDELVARIKARPVVDRYVSNGVEVVVHGFPRD